MATLKIDFSKTGVRDLKVKMLPRGVDPSKVSTSNVNTLYWKQNHPRATPTIVYSRGDLTQAPGNITFGVIKAESCDTSKAVCPYTAPSGGGNYQGYGQAVKQWESSKANVPTSIAGGFYDKFTYQFIDAIVADLNKYYSGTTFAWEKYGGLKSSNKYYTYDRDITPYMLVIVLSNFGEMLPTGTSTSQQQTAHFFTTPLTFMLAIKKRNSSNGDINYLTLNASARMASLYEAELSSNATWVCLQDKRITWENNNTPTANLETILSPYWRNVTRASPIGKYYMGTFSELYNTAPLASGYTGNHLGFIPAIARGQVPTTVHVKSIWFGPAEKASSSTDWDKYTIARQTTDYDSLVHFNVASITASQQVSTWCQAPIMGKEVYGMRTRQHNYYNKARFSALNPNSLICALATRSYI